MTHYNEKTPYLGIFCWFWPQKWNFKNQQDLVLKSTHYERQNDVQYADSYDFASGHNFCDECQPTRLVNCVYRLVYVPEQKCTSPGADKSHGSYTFEWPDRAT